MSANNSDSSPSEGEDIGAGAATGAATGSVAGPWGMAIGAGLGVVGGILAANSQSKIDQEKAQAEEEQAQQVAMREAANDAIRQTTTYQSKLDFGASYAASGHEGSGVGSQLEIQRQSDLQTMLNDQDALFQEKMLKEGAGLENQLASSTQTAGYIGAAGTILSGAGRAFAPSTGMTSAPSSPTTLPAFSG